MSEVTPPTLEAAPVPPSPQKKSRKTKWLWLLLLLLCLLVGYCSFGAYKKKKEAEAAKLQATREAMEAKKAVQEPDFDLSALTPVAVQVQDASAYITSAAEFTRIMEENIAQAKQNKAAVISIPPIAIFFKKGSPYVGLESRYLLASFAKYYNKTNKNTRILIEGYACDLGEERLNENMSRVRAEKSALFLSQVNFPDDKMDKQWYGQTKVGEKMFSNREEYRRVNVSLR